MSPPTENNGGRPDPDDDPFACSLCGHYLSSVERVEGHDYCRSCRREYGPDEYHELHPPEWGGRHG